MIPHTDVITPGRSSSRLSLGASREGDPGGGSTGGKRPAKKAAKKAAKKPAKKGK
jgi:hypothetical protein